jgi:hypothetical protein
MGVPFGRSPSWRASLARVTVGSSDGNDEVVVDRGRAAASSSGFVLVARSGTRNDPGLEPRVVLRMVQLLVWVSR